jgi:hypothetical protein
MRWHILGIEGNSRLNGIEEEVSGHGWDANKFGAALHPLGVTIRAEDGNSRIIGQAESLQAFVGLLAVVEGRSHAMDTDVRVSNELER